LSIAGKIVAPGNWTCRCSLVTSSRTFQLLVLEVPSVLFVIGLALSVLQNSSMADQAWICAGTLLSGQVGEAKTAPKDKDEVRPMAQWMNLVFERNR
jgi:hypothetical protein